MNELRPLAGTGDEKPRRWFLRCHEQWSGLVSRCNWYDFTLVKIQGEYAPYAGRWEFEFSLLGVGLCLTYVYDLSFNDEMLSLQERITNELAGRTGCEVQDPLGSLDNLDHH